MLIRSVGHTIKRCKQPIVADGGFGDSGGFDTATGADDWNKPATNAGDDWNTPAADGQDDWNTPAAASGNDWNASSAPADNSAW